MYSRNDFRRLRTTLKLDGKPDRVPLIELYVDEQVKAAYLGKPIKSAEDEVEFWVTAGYDYVPVSLGLISVGGTFSDSATMVKRHTYSIYSEEPVEMKWAAEGEGVITSWEDFESFQWPTVDDMDFSQAEAIARCLPDEMRIIAVLGKVYTAVWMLMGFEGFSFASVENPELVSAMFNRIGELQFAALKVALGMDKVGGAWMSDDIAYFSGLLVQPAILRQRLFPWYKKMGDYCRQRDEEMVYIYHSDGDLTEVLDDIIDCGFNALHPIEPKAMDSRELKQRVGDKLCLLGNIELDRLSRGTPQEAREMAERNIRELGYNGGYCLGSSNSVAYYVPVENYRAMIETVFGAQA